MTDGVRSLRVQLVTPGFPPARGGVEEHASQLATRLARHGDRVSVLTASRDGAVGVLHRPDGIDVRTYRAWRTTAMSVSPRLALGALTARAADADIIHVHSYHATSGFGSLAGLRRPLVFTPHYHGTGHSPLARALHVGYQVVGRAMFAAADAVICVSHAERDAVVRDFPKVAGKIRVIPNGVDRSAILRARPIPDQPPTVLVIGRLEPYKNVDVVVRAIAGLPAAQLVIIGTGSESAALAGLASELGIASRVRLLGNVDEAELHGWMRTASVLASLSDHEAFGMVPLEAATAGARAVLSGIPAHREIAGTWLENASELVSAQDIASVTGAIDRALGETRRAEVLVPDWDDVATATREVYLGVLGARSASSSAGRTS